MFSFLFHSNKQINDSWHYDHVFILIMVTQCFCFIIDFIDKCCTHFNKPTQDEDKFIHNKNKHSDLFPIAISGLGRDSLFGTDGDAHCTFKGLDVLLVLLRVCPISNFHSY